MSAKKETRAERRRRVMRNRAIAIIILAVIIILVIVLIVKCSSGKNNNEESPSESETETETETEQETEEEETYPDIVNEKPITLYLQVSSEKKCTKVTEVTDEWTDTADLATFTAFLCDDDEITYSAWVTAVKESWNSVETETEYKVGYELSFDLDGENIIITILEPEDVENSEYLYNGDYPSSGDYSAITGYMGVWLYDDMAHEVGEWYSHVTSSTKTDSTVLTSIKLRPTPQSDEISNLVLRGFSYSSDEEFDEDGNYTGAYAYTVTITNGAD